MKKTLALLFAFITASVSAQEVENVLDTTKTPSREFGFGLHQNAINFNAPLFILGEEEIKQEQLSKIDPNQINSIQVIKDSTGVVKYGDKAKFGVVIIEMKNPKFKLKQAPPDKE
jgi:hypothetical protein